MRKLGIYRVEYEIPSKTSEWKAFVGAYGAEEAIGYLSRKLGKINVKTVGFECRLDAISDSLAETIVQANKKGPGRPKGSTTKKKK
jgi:hypothetical protein